MREDERADIAVDYALDNKMSIMRLIACFRNGLQSIIALECVLTHTL